MEKEITATKHNEVIIDPELECSVCNDILFKPVSLNCGHTYCKECLINILRIKPQCPLCRTPCFLQESNLKENVTLKTIIENKYPALIKQRQALTKAENSKEEEGKRDDLPQTEPPKQPFNPLVIFPLCSADKVIFPGTEEFITIRVNYDPVIIQNVCNDKKFLAITDDLVQERKQTTTCIYEFLDLQPLPNSKDLYKAKVKTCERVVVNHYTNMDLDKQVLENWGITNVENVIVFNIGNGYILKDHNIATNQQMENQVIEIEEFLNEKINHWLVSSPDSAQYVINQLSAVMQQGQERTSNYFIDFSFAVARILRCTQEEKKRMYETTNTLERLLIIKHIIDRLAHTAEFGMIIEADIPGQKLFGSVKASILVLIGVIIMLLFFNHHRGY